MTTARRELIDLDVTRYYHCISRCVRGAFLCGGVYEYRKDWLERRLEQLATNFSISVGGFVVMDNHLHVLVRIDPEPAERWSDEEVVRRWISAHPPKNIDWNDENSVQKWIKEYSKDPKQIKKYRERLADLGWFMKSLKQPLSQMSNAEDGTKGTFWEGRYQSIAVLDEEAILAMCAYIDLNPVAAGVAKTPEKSRYTSINQRVDHFRTNGNLQALRSAQTGSVQASRTIGNAEQDHWLIPFEDRRPHTNSKPSSDREGMLEKFTLGNYMMLVEYTGRLFRSNKARIRDTEQQVFDRLDTSVTLWGDRVKKMLSAKRLRGRCFAASTNGMKASIEKGLSPRAINLSVQG